MRKNEAMLDDFRLRVFVAVAQMKSFSKAAAKLNISQPAVSQHVSELEKQLGVKLFLRQAGETVLTPSGNVFIRYAGKVLDEYSTIGRMFSLQQHRVVKISSSEDIYDYIMTELLADFLTIHPEIVFMKSFPDEADLQVGVVPDQTQTARFSIRFYPSETFATTSLWDALSFAIEQAMKE